MIQCPYISVVVTSRNDNYGENMQRRLDMFVKSLDSYQKKYPNLFELVFVEWNPPTDRGPLHEILPACTDLPIRVITVPKHYHDLTGLKRPLAEWPAKNVGVRRSRGNFVLVSNPDILLSPALVDYFSQRSLLENAVYRCDRYDFDGTGIESVNPDEYVVFAHQKIFKLHGMQNQNSLTLDIDMTKNNGTIPVSTYNENTIHTNGAGDFMLISKNAIVAAGGLYQGPKCQGHGDSVSMVRLLHRGVGQVLFKYPGFTLHQDHDRNIIPGAWDFNSVLETAREEDNDTSWGIPDVALHEWNNTVEIK